MRVGFSHIRLEGRRSSDALVNQMIASVRRAMPDVSIVQFTDLTTSPQPNVDQVVRRPRLPLALGCLDHYATAGPGDWLFLDTDVVVQRDVREVFRDAFDIALATREGTLKQKEIGTKFMARNPYNKGAVFSRSPLFWESAKRWLLLQSEALQAWMGDQRAMNHVLGTHTFLLRVLPNSFNYPPMSRTDDIREKAIVHFKGDRKRWLPVVA